MSAINYKEDSIKANILMEEGDSSLEPGEVKTPPHGNEITKSKADEGLKVKCTASHILPRAKSDSKQETDRCAEKVRAILELDAIKRKEELERKKEQKSDSSLQKTTIKKKEHKKLKISKIDSKKADIEEYASEKVKEDVIKKPKRKKSKHAERKSYSKHHSDESCESMRPIGSAASLPMISPMSFVTPPSNVSSNFSRRFSDLNNPTPFRSYNPFMKNYRPDFRHRGGHFGTHNRTRFSRYRSQYVSGSFHAPAEEPCQSQHPLSSTTYSELMWTKTKPSISYAFNLLERVPIKKKRNSSDQNVQKKKKNKKSKEREGSNKSLSSTKSSRKSSKRKKIRKIRESLSLQPAKKQLLSPNKELVGSTADDDGHTPENENNDPETPICTIKKEESPEPISNKLTEPINLKSIKQESKKEDSKLAGKTGDSGKPHILDMFASLTPPKQRSPSVDSKSALSTPTNVQITHKFQEIQDRIDKLLEDDDELKLEAIQATKDKLLQKSREHTENLYTAKSSKKIKNSNAKDKKNSNMSELGDKSPDRIVKQRSKDRDTYLSKPFDDAKRKEKTPIDIFSDKKDERKHKKDKRESTPTKTTHSKILHKYSPSLKHQKKGNTLNSRENSSKNKEFTSIRRIKNLTSLEDSPNNLTNSALRTLDGSPDTDDYSDNWENDDEEVDINSAFQNVNHLEMSKNVAGCSPSSSVAGSEDSESSSIIQSTTPKNSPPQQCLSPKVSYTPRQSPKVKDDSDDTNELQRLYNQFIKSVEGADIKPTEESDEIAHIEVKKEIEGENLSTSSASYSSSSSSSSDTSISSSGSSSSTSSSDSASDDSNDTDTIQKAAVHSPFSTENATETTSFVTSADEQNIFFLNTKDDSKPNVAKDLKKLENLEANLLRIQMMRANYDSADEISDELLKMEKLFLLEKNIILNKFKDSSTSNSAKKEIETQNELDAPMQATVESLQSKGQFVQSLQKLQNKDDKFQASNIFDTNREVIKLTISPVKLPKTSAIFEADNEMEIAKQTMETSEKSNTTEKPPKPVKEVAIVKPIMESKEPPSGHHQKRRRSPMPSHHSLQSRSRTRRGRVRSLSVSPQRNGSGRCTTPQRRGAFSKQSRIRNFERRSRSRSPSVTRPLSRRSGDISPVPRKRRSLFNIDDRFRKHSPRRDSRSRSRSRSPSSPPPRHRCDRYSRSPLPFKPPSPPADPTSSPSDSRRSSLSPPRRSRSISRSPRKRTDSPPSKSYDSNRHRSLSPKHQPYKPHSPRQSNTSYYFNNSPSRISLDARINIVLNGPSSSQNENNSIAAYEDYNNYGQYGPATYMSLPSDSNSFYTNQYVPMANAGATVQPTHAIQPTYSNLPAVANDQTELFSSVSHQANVNASNFYYNRFGSQPFGLNAPSPLLKELPKATVAVQKGNVLEIVPCSDLLTDTVAEHTNENKKVSSNQQVMDEATSSNKEKGKRSILKPLDGESNSSRSAYIGPPKKKKVNFEDGVFPNHNSDDEDRKVVEAKIRVKMRRLRKKLGITPPCHNLFQDKARKAKQKAKSDKKTPPPPPPNGSAPPNLEQPIYLRTHTPTPLLYFHFDGVVHSMYVSQMERPIPPRLLNPKCLSTNNISVVSQHTEAQSPLYMQSPISAGAPHLHTSKKDPIATFTRPNRTENISPKIISSTTPTSIQQATGSPKINYKLYSPIESIHHTEIGSATLPSTSPNSIKGSAIHTISSTTIGNHFLPKRQESPKDVVGTRTNISMGLLPTPMSHPPVATQGTVITTHTRIPVIGVPPTVIPKVVPSLSESFMGGGFASTMMQTSHHTINNLNQNYMVPPPIAHINNPHMTGGVQQYFNSPVQRMHRPLPNYMVQQPQPSPTPSNLPMCHLVDPAEAANTDLDKFANPQAMAIPYNFKGP